MRELCSDDSDDSKIVPATARLASHRRGGQAIKNAIKKKMKKKKMKKRQKKQARTKRQPDSQCGEEEKGYTPLSEKLARRRADRMLAALESGRATEEMRGDRGRMLKALFYSYGEALKYASEALRSDPEFVRTALHFSNGQALKHAASELQCSHDIVAEAVQLSSGWALRHAAEDVRADRTFIAEAVVPYLCASGLALQFATEEVLGDLHVMFKAAHRTFGSALKYASSSVSKEVAVMMHLLWHHLPRWAVRVKHFEDIDLEVDRELLESSLQQLGLQEPELVGVIVSLLSGRSCYKIFNLVADDVMTVKRECAKSLGLEYPDLVAKRGELVCGMKVLTDVSELERGKVHEMQLVLASSQKARA